MSPRKRKRQAGVSTRNQAPATLTSSLGGSFRFLELPLEIRQRIYREFFQLQHLPSKSQSGSDPGLTPQEDSDVILHTSRQVHMEAWPIYTEHRVFVFTDPMKMANTFLSFLPQQRLHSVKHLKLWNIHSSNRPSIRDFERIWWYYLDVFTRLDTIVFTDIGYNAPYRIHIMLSVIIGLLRQGAPSRPRWVHAKFHDPLTKSKQKLPASFDWVIQLGVMRLSGGNFRSEDYGEITFRKGNEILQRSVICDRRILQRFGMGNALSYMWKHDLQPDPAHNDLRYRTINPMTNNNISGTYALNIIKLGPNMRCLNDMTNRPTPVDFINIGGRWINDDDS